MGPGSSELSLAYLVIKKAITDGESHARQAWELGLTGPRWPKLGNLSVRKTSGYIGLKHINYVLTDMLQKSPLVTS